jgi:hypothetical protein
MAVEAFPAAATVKVDFFDKEESIWGEDCESLVVETV